MSLISGCPFARHKGRKSGDNCSYVPCCGTMSLQHGRGKWGSNSQGVICVVCFFACALSLCHVVFLLCFRCFVLSCGLVSWPMYCVSRCVMSNCGLFVVLRCGTVLCCAWGSGRRSSFLPIAIQVKSIGLSNYTIEDYKELKAVANVPPSINQIEVNPFLYRKKACGHDDQFFVVPDTMCFFCNFFRGACSS